MITDKKELMKARKEAYRIYLLADRTKLSSIAKEVGMSLEQVKKYKEKDRWIERKAADTEDGVLKNEVSRELKKTNYEASNEEEIDQLQAILDSSGVSDKQQLFIMYYLQSYNISWAAMKVGYSKSSAHVRGNIALKDPLIADTINKIKKVMHSSIYLRAQDIIDEYIKIAFADITDFLEFDNERVTLKPSNEVDGKLIVEVKQGRDGITLKMADKMKAFERLEKFFELMPDKQHEVSMKRLELEQQKFAFTKKVTEDAGEEGNSVTIVNDIR